MSRDLPKMLPQCDGPKLHPFSKRAVDIQFVRLLSDNEQDGQSHVFEVIIDGMRYALKVVDAISCSCPGQADATNSSNSMMWTLLHSA